MSSRRLSAAGSALLLMVCALPAWGVQVGRAKFDLPSQDWVLVASRDHQLSLDGGISNIPMHTAAFALPGAKNVPAALMIVTSTQAGNDKRVRWVSDPCPQPRARFFANDYGTRRRPNQRECLVVNAAFAPAIFFAKDEWLLQALQARGWFLFKSGQSMRSTVGSEVGTFLHVHLATRQGFAGKQSEPPDATDLHDVPKQLVAWGEALHEAVKASVYSLSGNVTMPPIVFDKE